MSPILCCPLNPRVIPWLRSASLIMAAIGSLLSSPSHFGVFTDNIKDTFNLSQTQVETVLTYLAYGSHLHLPAGWLLMLSGPSPAVIFSLILGSGGYLLLWQSTEHPSWYHRYPHMLGMYCLIMGIGTSSGFIVMLNTNMESFSPKFRATVMALLDSMHVVTPGVTALLYSGILDEDLGKLFLVWGLAVGIVYGTGLFVWHSYPQDESTCNQVGETTAILQSENETNCPPPLTLKEILQHPEFHLNMWPVVINHGFQLMLVNNTSIVLRSFHMEEHNSMVNMVTSVAGVLGQMVASLLSDQLLHLVPRVAFCLIPTLLQSFLLLLGVFYLENLVFITLISAYSLAHHGIMWAVMATILGETFGWQTFGRDIGIITLAGAFYLHAIQIIFGTVYDNHIHNGDINECYGTECYTAIMIIGSITTLATCPFLAILWSMARTNKRRVNELSR